MTDSELTSELLSRGLDADLDRAEMRRLYRLASRDDSVRAEMAELAAAEEGLAALAELSRDRRPSRDIAAAVSSGIAPARRPLAQRLWS